MFVSPSHITDVMTIANVTERAHSTPEPDIPPPPEGDPLTPPPEKLPQTDPVPIEEPTPPQPPVKLG